MEEYNENIGCLFILLIIFGAIILLFLTSYYNLYRFKKCYDNNFIYPYCENYKNY